MPLWFFGGQGSGETRACPACELDIAAQATFCPFCCLVIRPEGTADLREHLRGGRIPTDVYLLRKMQVEDPNTGPVIRVSEIAPTSPPVAASDPSVPRTQESLPFSTPFPATSQAFPPVTAAESAKAPQPQTHIAPRVRTWTGVPSLLKFEEPLPPPTRSIDETPTLFAWMLERDPVIPNNVELLETIHASNFRDTPAAHLGYAQHLLLQIADDLLLHPTQDVLNDHLTVLAAAYRRAAGAYYASVQEGQDTVNVALWQMASLASRLRVEAWVYHSRHGHPPAITHVGWRAEVSKALGG
jgi:hypothetical protein